MNLEKRVLRQRLRAQRRALCPDLVAAAGREAAARLRGLGFCARAVSVIAYIGDENEVPTDVVLEDVARTDTAIYLPRSGGGVVRWRPGDALALGRGSVLEPAGGLPEPPPLPALALVPVVAWDAAGGRLGRGGGFYDRLLTQLTPGVIRVGLAYEFQECPAVPREAWDVCLDYVITERRIVRCGDAAAGVSLQKGGLQS